MLKSTRKRWGHHEQRKRNAYQANRRRRCWAWRGHYRAALKWKMPRRDAALVIRTIVEPESLRPTAGSPHQPSWCREAISLKLGSDRCQQQWRPGCGVLQMLFTVGILPMMAAAAASSAEADERWHPCPAVPGSCGWRWRPGGPALRFTAPGCPAQERPGSRCGRRPRYQSVLALFGQRLILDPILVGGAITCGSAARPDASLRAVLPAARVDRCWSGHAGAVGAPRQSCHRHVSSASRASVSGSFGARRIGSPLMWWPDRSRDSAVLPRRAMPLPSAPGCSLDLSP